MTRRKEGHRKKDNVLLWFPRETDFKARIQGQVVDSRRTGNVSRMVSKLYGGKLAKIESFIKSTML